MHQQIGEYLVRDWKTEDASAVADYANNRKIWQNLRDAFPHPYDLEDAKTFIVRAQEKKPPTLFAIATEKEAIGSIGLMPGQDVHRYSAEMGYWLAEPYWGKGIMTQAVKYLTDYAISELELIRIYAEPYTTNPASARVLEKAGYKCEGVLRSNVYKDGRLLDQFLYSYVAGAADAPALRTPAGS
jgi:[ribosomal protein S5]-alanine N-acetyltransferase